MTMEANHVLRYLGLVCPQGFRRFSWKYQLFWDQELLPIRTSVGISQAFVEGRVIVVLRRIAAFLCTPRGAKLESRE